MFDLDRITRENIRNLKPYSSARSEFTGDAAVFLDANENPFNTECNRYPDPLQRVIKGQIAALRHVRPGQIFLGNGSDEPIDLLYRAFCEPGKSNAVAMDPTYGMYEVAAGINGVEYRKVLLSDAFTLDVDQLLAATDAATRLLFVCSPNNPTGNTLPHTDLQRLVAGFEGIVVIDEAYNDFSEEPSMLAELDRWPNLVVLQTFSKAWGLAGIRLGMAFASEDIVSVLTKIKYPYNINILTQRMVHERLLHPEKVQDVIGTLVSERRRMAGVWKETGCIEEVFPSQANFLLVKTQDANKLYNYLVGQGIIVRNRNNVSLCKGCLRLTIGTPEENDRITAALKAYSEANPQK